ncbi:hypothetical protein [Hymenobacter terrenus]|uniref:hypothetical protein n=1 Tax=Hymenobacter terrenus TaxID=1629124 RepID=UPI000AD070D0|nr:hypothetical protein [Hymenobacter terrenus]
MKTKSLLFAIGFCALLLSGCVGASVGVGVGTGYGYYPPVDPFYSPYYGPVRPYFHRPRPIVVVSQPYYRSPHHGNRANGGSTYRRQENYNGNNGARTHGHIRRRAD